MKISWWPGSAAWILTAVAWLLCFVPTTQRGPQFYFQNPPAQQARLLPSTFPQPGFNQYQNFFPPVHTGPEAYSPFRPTGNQPPGRTLQDSQQQYNLPGYQQQPGLNPSPFQLPRNTPGQAQPQQYSTFQTINPPTNHDHIQTPPAFFQQQPPYQPIQNQDDIKKVSAAIPTVPSSQGPPERITSNSKYNPRDPNNLRLIQGFTRYQQSPAFEDRFATTKQPKRTQTGFDSFGENHRTSLFSRPFPIDDVHVNSFVDQRLEVDDGAAGDSNSNSQQTSSLQKDRNSESTLRKKTTSRTHPNSRNNIPAQRTRLPPSDSRNRPIQNDSYTRDETETVSSTPTSKFRGRNRDNYFQSTTSTTTTPSTRSRNRFVTTKSPNRLTHQFNARPTFPSRKITTTSTTESEPPVDPLVFGSEEILYDEAYDQEKSSEVTPKSTSTTDPTVIYNVTTFRYTTEKSKDSLGNPDNTSSDEEVPVNGNSTSVSAVPSTDSEDGETEVGSIETHSLSSAEKEEIDSEENDSREESNRTTLHDDLIDESDVPENHPYWSPTPETNTFVNNERTNDDANGNSTGAFEILTMNPQHVLVEQDNFKTFVDSGLIDATEIPLTSPESIDNITENPEYSVPENKTSPTPASPQTSTSPSEGKDGRPMEEAIVSVVTTKSVINGSSMVVTMPPVAEVTGQVAPTSVESTEVENNSTTSTESWVIVASVQTSRSVSGARFLPEIIRQEERVLPVSGKSFIADAIPKNKETSTSEERTTKSNTFISTESIIDKLDRVQSELSSGILTRGEVQLEVLTEKPGAMLPQMNIGRTTESPVSTTTYKSPVFIRKFSPHHGSTSSKKNQDASSIQDDEHPKSKLPGLRPITSQKAGISDDLVNKPQSDQPSLPVTNSKLRSGIRSSGGRSSAISNFQNRVRSQDTPSLPPDHKARSGTTNDTKSININDFISSLKFEDVSSLLPPGYNASKYETSTQSKPKESITQANSTTGKTNLTNVSLQKANIDDISAFLPPGYKEKSHQTSTTAKPKGIESIFQKAAVDDIGAFLPPGYEKQAKASTASPEKNKDFESLLSKAKTDDIKSFLPPGYVSQAKPISTTTEKSSPFEKLFNKAKQENIDAFLPPGFVLQAKEPSTTEKPSGLESILNGAKPVDISDFLPPGFHLSTAEPIHNVGGGTNNDGSSPETSTKSFKVKFPSVPGMTRRTTLRPTTTTKSFGAPKPSLAPIQKGWPTRVTTLFTGWSTPSTTPMTKILETTTATTTTTSTTTTTTSTTTTTTTPRPTTPGICTVNCDLAATIKLVGSDQWVPELLDHNTREWQDMANEVQSQLQAVFTSSESLGQWFRKVRIDDFSEASEGSVLVDYFVELTDLGRQLNTQELKKLFHESLKETSPVNDEEVLDDNVGDVNETSVFNGTEYKSPENLQNLLKLGRFDVDPMYTDFTVIPKRLEPTVGYAEEDIFIPQWAIAGIVIGLASLLFVIIFGVTVLVNRHKNNKKKQPTPLTEDMLNELNKNHMSGLDNYAAEDLYNMEDVWNEKPHEKPPKKRSSTSVQENSMSNLYDSWRSEWNGYYYNAYYGNGSSTSGYTRRRSDYDTNF